MGRLGGPKALGIVLKEKTVCHQVAGGWAAFPLALHSEAKLGPLPPTAQVGRLSTEAPADTHARWRIPRKAEAQGGRHAHMHRGRRAGRGAEQLQAHAAAAHALLEHASICAGNAGPGVACACVCAHTCVGLSAPSAAESLVYPSSTLGPKLPPCWPPKPACLFQPLWPPVRELGKEEPPPHSWLRVSM